MVSLLLSSVFLALTILSPSLSALPFVGNDDTDQPSHGRQIQIGSACNTLGEVLSEDPCRPWCLCKDGVVVCAEIFCNSESDVPETRCGKIKVNGRCCPTFVCIHNNGTASMHYPLPLTVVPPSMYEDNVSSQSVKEKRNSLATLRRGKFV